MACVARQSHSLCAPAVPEVALASHPRHQAGKTPVPKPSRGSNNSGYCSHPNTRGQLTWSYFGIRCDAFPRNNPLRIRVGFAFNRSKAIRQRMLGLVKHDVVRARYSHHDHESEPVILNFAAELRSFALQFSNRV